jgi:hypothetical protein
MAYRPYEDAHSSRRDKGSTLHPEVTTEKWPRASTEDRMPIARRETEPHTPSYLPILYPA